MKLSFLEDPASVEQGARTENFQVEGKYNRTVEILWYWVG
jgi:hypothetical protein